MLDKPRIVFLYTRLADYFYQSVQAFLLRQPHFRATVITHRSDENAPYIFEETNQLSIEIYEDFVDVQAMIQHLDSDRLAAIYIAGWTDTSYLELIKVYRSRVPIIVGMDNPWKGTLRQKLASRLYKKRLQQQFTHIWCPGMPQLEFAKRLGFSYKQILTNLYVANTAPFHHNYQKNRPERQEKYPKRLLYLGRYVEYKQPVLLAKLFKGLVQAKANNGWTLELIGAGPLREQLQAFEGEFIKVNDFLSPEALPERLASYGAFCLPSQNEHWGVVVHEAAAAGLPLLLSDTVYSGTAFLIDQHNGWRFQSSAPEQLKEALVNLVNMPDNVLLKMGENSHRLSKKISHLDWEANLLSVIKS